MAGRHQNLSPGQHNEVTIMLDQAQKELSEKQQDQVVHILKDQFWKWVKIILLFTGGGIFLLCIVVFQSVKTTVTYLVAKQFEEPRIQQIVNEAAKDRASVLMEEQIQPEVDNFKLEVAKRIQDVNEFVTSETSGLKIVIGELQQKNYQNFRDLLRGLEFQKTTGDLGAFQTMLLGAQNGDREAYNQIIAWEDDKTFPISMQDLVKKALLNIRLGYFMEKRNGFSFLETQWKPGVDPNSLSLSDLASDASNQGELWLPQPGVVNYIWLREDYAKKERIQFLVDVLKTYRNLRAVNLAGTFLEKETKIIWDPFKIEPFVEWWEIEKSK